MSWAFKLVTQQSQKVYSSFWSVSCLNTRSTWGGKVVTTSLVTDLLKLTITPLLLSLSLKAWTFCLSPVLLKHREEAAEIAASWACCAVFQGRVVSCSNCWLLCLRIFLSVLYSRSGLCVWLEIDVHVLAWHSKCCDFSPLWSAPFLCTGSQLLAYLISTCFRSPYTFLHKSSNAQLSWKAVSGHSMFWPKANTKVLVDFAVRLVRSAVETDKK